MKKLLLALLVLCCSMSAYSQLRVEKDMNVLAPYFWTKSILIKACDIDGHPLDPEFTTYTIVGQRFDVVGFDTSNNLIIRILDYKNYIDEETGKLKASPEFLKYNYVDDEDTFNSLDESQKFAKDYDEDQKYFKITYAELQAVATRNYNIKASLAMGVLYFPFKYRPQNGMQDFSGSFNFGAAIGYTFRHKEWRKATFSLLGCYGMSNIKVDSVSITKGHDKLNTINDYTALSLSTGFIVQYEKIQAGAFIGVDRISNNNYKNTGWVYQGKPWFSIGFGYSLFSIQKEAKDVDKTQPRAMNTAAQKIANKAQKAADKAAKNAAKNGGNTTNTIPKSGTSTTAPKPIVRPATITPAPTTDSTNNTINNTTNPIGE